MSRASSRREARQLEDAEKATHFVVRWVEGDDKGMFSRVPRQSIASSPPFTVGCIVPVKFTARNGVTEKENAKIISKGNA
jgi:hypothetical protein